MMPLTAKGEKILSHLQEEYGAEKGKSVLYAGKNSGRFTGIDTAELDDADIEGIADWMDSYRRDADKAEPTYNREAVQKAIEASKKPISPKEAKLIHVLLKGRGDLAVGDMAKLDALCDAAQNLENRVDMRLDDHRVLGGVGFTPPSGGVR